MFLELSKKVSTILVALIVSGCGFSLHSNETNINFSSLDNDYKAKQWGFASEYVIDNIIEHKSSEFPNNNYTKKLDDGTIKFSFSNQYARESKYAGVWPLLPLFPYIKIGEGSNKDVCKDNNINLLVEIIPDLEEMFSPPQYDISKIYIKTEHETVYPLEKDRIMVRVKDYAWKEGKDYPSADTILSFPLKCKDLDNSMLVIEEIIENKKKIKIAAIPLEYKKGSDKIYGISIVAILKSVGVFFSKGSK